MVNPRAHQIMRGVHHTKGFTSVHHKFVTLNNYFVEKFSVSKNEPLTNQCLSGFNLDFALRKYQTMSS